jgi:hypothetical protein
MRNKYEKITKNERIIVITIVKERNVSYFAVRSDKREDVRIRIVPLRNSCCFTDLLLIP